MKILINGFYLALFLAIALTGLVGDQIYSLCMSNPAVAVKVLATAFWTLWQGGFLVLLLWELVDWEVVINELLRWTNRFGANHDRRG